MGRYLRAAGRSQNCAPETDLHSLGRWWPLGCARPDDAFGGLLLAHGHGNFCFAAPFQAWSLGDGNLFLARGAHDLYAGEVRALDFRVGVPFLSSRTFLGGLPGSARDRSHLHDLEICRVRRSLCRGQFQPAEWITRVGTYVPSAAAHAPDSALAIVAQRLARSLCALCRDLFLVVSQARLSPGLRAAGFLGGLHSLSLGIPGRQPGLRVETPARRCRRNFRRGAVGVLFRGPVLLPAANPRPRLYRHGRSVVGPGLLFVRQRLSGCAGARGIWRHLRARFALRDLFRLPHNRCHRADRAGCSG